MSRTISGEIYLPPPVPKAMTQEEYAAEFAFMMAQMRNARLVDNEKDGGE